MSNLDVTQPPAEREAAAAASVPASNGAPKCKKKKVKKQQEQKESTPYLDSTAKAKRGGVEDQEAAAAAASRMSSEGSPKSIKKKKSKVKDRGMPEEEATTTVVSASEGSPKSIKKKKAKVKDTGTPEEEATTKVLSALEGSPKSINKKKAKVKDRGMPEEEATTTVLSTPEGSPKSIKKKKKTKVKDRGMPEEEATTAVLLVFRRPYCDDFLRFCFQNFELGIWSSRKKENVNSVVNILVRDLKQYLLFCWDMSHCTYTGYDTIDNKQKPLVLKELKKLWNKEVPNLPWEHGDFLPSNTLLVDDSPYKALCNPPHTAIFPYPYSYHNQGDDYSLGPGGDLRVYLEKLAAADDVQTFVRDYPFGQCAITQSEPHWNFYEKIACCP